MALRGRTVGRLAAVLAATDLVFIGGMVAFIHYWDRLDQYGPRGRTFIRYVLVQFHLGTENVVAAWYSSMLLLSVAAAAYLAYAVDARQPRQRMDRWLNTGWLGFAALFTMLSLDEVGSFHERIGMMVALNKASLEPSATGPVGWVYMLAIPIGVVALLILAFAWLRLRHAPLAFVLLGAGVALYLSDPFLEVLEGALVKRHAWSGLIVERVLEEGVAELGGTLCFLTGVLMYVVRTGGGRQHSFSVPRRSAIAAAAIGGTLLTAGAPIAHWFVGHLPAGDSGIPENWFPAAALYVFAILVTAAHGRRALAPAAGAIVLSAYFGAGLFVYAGWFRLFGYRGVLVDALATAAAAGLLMIAITRQHSAPDAQRAVLRPEHS